MQGHDLELGRVDHPVQECNQRLQETENSVHESENSVFHSVHESENSVFHSVQESENPGQESENPYILKIQIVTRQLRNDREKSFTPELVSIGPLHRGNVKVKEFERKKKIILDNLLERSSECEEIYKSCKQLVQGSLDTIKKCYNEVEFDDDTCDMIVNDALFILSFCLMCLEHEHASHLPNRFDVEAIKHDLALAENQIPLFILNEIFQCVNSKMNLDTSLVKLLMPILAFNNPFEEELAVENVSIDGIPHILGLLHIYYKPCSTDTSNGVSFNIYSAVKLDKAGVSFKLKSGLPMAVKVEVPNLGRVTIEIPRLCFDGRKEAVFRNLIAFEQQYTSTSYFTSYFYVMTMLADTKEDVGKLVDSGVIVNLTRSNEQVVNIIKDMLKDVTRVDFIWKKEWETLNKYYNGNLRAKLWRSCFSSLWSKTSKVFAVIAFLFSVVSSALAIYSIIKVITRS